MLTKQSHQPKVKRDTRPGHSTLWKVDYRDSAGVRHRKFNFESKQAAVNFASELPDHSVAEPDHQTVRGYAPVYLKSVEGKTSARIIGVFMRSHILPFLGDKVLRDLKRPDGEQFIAHLKAKNLAPGSIRLINTYLMALLNLSVEDEVLDRNRLKGKKGKSPVPQGDVRARVFTNEELGKLFKASEPQEQATWQFLLNTGLRPGKLLELTSGMVTMMPECGLNMPPDATAIKQTPRWMPLNRMAYNALQGRSGRLFPYTSQAMLYQKLRTAARYAGIEDVQARDFRRTFSSRLDNLGTPYLIRERLLGHGVGLANNYCPELESRKQMLEAVRSLEIEYGNCWQSKAVNA